MVSPVEVDQNLLDDIGKDEESDQSRSERNEDAIQVDYSSKMPGSEQRDKRHTPDWIAGSDGK